MPAVVVAVGAEMMECGVWCGSLVWVVVDDVPVAVGVCAGSRRRVRWSSAESRDLRGGGWSVLCWHWLVLSGGPRRDGTEGCHWDGGNACRRAAPVGVGQLGRLLLWLSSMPGGSWRLRRAALLAACCRRCFLAIVVVGQV